MIRRPRCQWGRLAEPPSDNEGVPDEFGSTPLARAGPLGSVWRAWLWAQAMIPNCARLFLLCRVVTDAAKARPRRALEGCSRRAISGRWPKGVRWRDENPVTQSRRGNDPL